MPIPIKIPANAIHLLEFFALLDILKAKNVANIAGTTERTVNGILKVISIGSLTALIPIKCIDQIPKPIVIAAKPNHI